jgi:hypothetical protein
LLQETPWRQDGDESVITTLLKKKKNGVVLSDAPILGDIAERSPNIMPH